MNIDSKISFEFQGAEASAEIKGSKEEILFSWIALTHIVLKRCGQDPYSIGPKLGYMIDGYKKAFLNGGTIIGVDVTQAKREGSQS